jgi:hypothetical protein
LAGRWQHVWLVAIVPPERWGKMDRNLKIIISSLHHYKNNAWFFSLIDFFLMFYVRYFFFVTYYRHLPAASHNFFNASGSGNCKAPVVASQVNLASETRAVFLRMQILHNFSLQFVGSDIFRSRFVLLLYFLPRRRQPRCLAKYTYSSKVHVL